MGQGAREPLELAPFRAFGPSTFWPFRRRLQAIAVTEDYARVRRTMRDECPNRPGVYGMVDAREQLIYVGMSTVLPKRLVTYFQSSANERKEYRIASHTNRLVWEVLGHGLAAELRELELIRHHQPRFNVKGRRSGRALGYIFISREDAPRVRIARQAPRGVRYFWGPFAINWRLKEAVEEMNRQFKLRDCRAATVMHFADQHELFPLELRAECVRGETGSCVGPCAGLCTRSQYMAQLRAARAFLDGRDRSQLDELETRVKEAAADRQFERAAVLRDRLVRLNHLWDRLAALREPALPAQFVYPVTLGKQSLWYVVAASRVVTATRVPVDAAGAIRTAARLERAYDAAAIEQLPGDRLATQILAGWFRNRREELQAALTPGEALDVCRRLCG